MSANGHDLGPDAVKAKGNEGNVDIALGQVKGKVVMRFYRPVDTVTFDPSNAVDFGKQMIDLAVACGAHVTIQVPRRQITKEQRDKLINRAMLVYKSLTDKGKSPAVVARHVIDSVLSAID